MLVAEPDADSTTRASFVWCSVCSCRFSRECGAPARYLWGQPSAVPTQSSLGNRS